MVKTLLVRELRSCMLCSVSEKKKKLCVLFEPSPMAAVKLVMLRTPGSLGGHQAGLPSSPQAGVLNKAVAFPSVLMRFRLGLFMLLGHWNLMEARVCHLAKGPSLPG